MVGISIPFQPVSSATGLSLGSPGPTIPRTSRRSSTASPSRRSSWSPSSSSSAPGGPPPSRGR